MCAKLRHRTFIPMQPASGATVFFSFFLSLSTQVNLDYVSRTNENILLSEKITFSGYKARDLLFVFEKGGVCVPQKFFFRKLLS